MRFFLLFALPEEFRPLRRRLPGWTRQGRPVPHWRFTCARQEIIATITGMGAAATTRALAGLAPLGPPAVLISAGFGGALTAAPPPGGVQLAASVWRYEPETAGLVQVAECPTAAALAARLQAAGHPTTAGAVVSLPAILPKAGLRRLTSNLRQPVIDLESAASAAWARAQGCEFWGLRAITDGGGEEIAPFLATLLNTYHRVPLVALVRTVAWRGRRWCYLARLWHRSRLAGRRLAAVLEVLLTTSDWFGKPPAIASQGQSISRQRQINEEPYQAQGQFADSKGQYQVKN